MRRSASAPPAKSASSSWTQLKGLDTVAYIRFASVYRDFTDVREFKEELEGLLAQPRQEQKLKRALSF